MTTITTTFTKPQLVLLERLLRGTGQTLSSSQADAQYGIKNLRARMTEMRQAGLRVRATRGERGRKSYSVSARDITGSRLVRRATTAA